MPARYRVLSWSIRILRMLVVVAVAVLSAVVIGGVGTYLINDASTEPPSAGTHTSKVPIATSGARPPPMQTAAEPPTSAATAQDKPAGTADPASPPTLVQLSASQSTATAQPGSSADNVSPSTAAADQKPATQAATSDQIRSARKAAFGKKRVAVTGRRRTATASGEQRPVYDYYSRDNSDRRYGWRDDQNRSRGRQPTQSFFGGGFFSDNRYNDSRYNNSGWNDRDR
jgi:hypothetical protein